MNDATLENRWEREGAVELNGNQQIIRVMEESRAQGATAIVSITYHLEETPARNKHP